MTEPPRMQRSLHACSAFCQPDKNIHQMVYRVRYPVDANFVRYAVRFSVDPQAELLDFREAPEAPEVNPLLPEAGPWPYRYVVLVQFVNHDPLAGAKTQSPD